VEQRYLHFLLVAALPLAVVEKSMLSLQQHVLLLLLLLAIVAGVIVAKVPYYQLAFLLGNLDQNSLLGAVGVVRIHALREQRLLAIPVQQLKKKMGSGPDDESNTSAADVVDVGAMKEEEEEEEEEDPSKGI
jgi:hypothetical protein